MAVLHIERDQSFSTLLCHNKREKLFEISRWENGEANIFPNFQIN